MSSDLLSIGVSGLNYNQAALTTTGNNITNAATDGYTRQRVNAEANPSIQKGPNYFGTGVSIESVQRIADEFVNKQLNMDTSAFNQLQSYTDKISQIDSLITDPNAGLMAGVDGFFSALQNASNDPSSLPARQLVLSQSKMVTDRFNSINASFEDINNQINSESRSMVQDLNTMAQSVASINTNLMGTGNSQDQINDLLDKRDALIKKMSEIADLSVVKQGNGAVNIFVGGSNALVMGSVANQYQVVPGQTDPERMDISLVSKTSNVVITDKISGGKLGGLMNFRSTVLDKAMNDVGRLALNLSDAMNTQQQSGIDLNGNYGADLFSDFNDASSSASRVALDKNNTAPTNQDIGVSISDTTQLTDSDYLLSFTGNNGGSYELKRLSDSVVVASGTVTSARPMVIKADGFQINLNHGTFSPNDKVRIQPTRHAARDIDTQNIKPQSLAFAAPVVTQNSLGNTGTGAASPANVLNLIDPATGERLPLFQNAGQLSPPLIVHFTSPTTYDILDNSDPANPKNLDPPITNQLFIPGQSNTIFATEPGQHVMVSDGFNAGRIANNVVTIPPGSQPKNAYIAETLNFNYVDPTTGKTNTFTPLTINAGTSAKDIAATLSSRQGISARASTYAELKINDNGAGQPLKVLLNGVDLTATAPPSPVTPDYLATAINADASLQANGISAISNGTTIKIFSSSGVDFNLQVSGDATDTVAVKGDQGATLGSTKDISNGVDFNAGSPTHFTLDTGSGARTINLAGTFTDRQSAIDYIQSQVNAAFNSPSKVRVEADANGTIKFVTADTSQNATLAIGGVTNDVLGLASAALAGTVSPTDIVTVPGAGAGVVNALTVGGKVSVTLDKGYSMTTNAIGQGNLFSAQSQATSNYQGFTFDISGQPASGDEFLVNYNSDGVSDNRNALSMVGIQEKNLVSGSQTLSDGYGQLVADIGTLASQGNINKDASQAVLNQTQALRDSVSGVNMDEEAANLVKYEQAYTACSRVVTSAQKMLDALFAAMQ